MISEYRIEMVKKSNEIEVTYKCCDMKEIYNLCQSLVKEHNLKRINLHVKIPVWESIGTIE